MNLALKGKNIFKQSGDVGSVPRRQYTGATVWERPGSLKNLKGSQWVEIIQLFDEEGEEGRFVMRYRLRGLAKDSGLYSKSNRKLLRRS